MKCQVKYIVIVLMLLFVPLYLISCTGYTSTSLPSGKSSEAVKGPPGMPTNMSAVGTDSRVTIAWTPPPATGDNAATSYNLYWSMTSGVTNASNRILNVSMPFTHMDLMNGQTYYYRVCAMNIYGEGMLSSEVQATPMPSFTKILTKLTDPDAEEYEEFGYSVSIDGNYAVVGASRSSLLDPVNYIPNIGAAYVFHRKNGVWDPNGAKLIAFDAQSEDQFGAAVSISGDYVIVGARAEEGESSSSLQNAGAAYIFHRTGENSWDGGVKIVAPYPLREGGFGGAVSISGDYAVVGMTGSGSENSFYVYHRIDTNAWEYSDELYVPESEYGDLLGRAVAISGDNIIIGAPYYDGWIDNSVPDAGAAYIFHRGGGNSWELVSKIMPHDIRAGGMFGYSVAINGDYAVVGAHRQSDSQGSVYVYHRLEGNFWDEGTKLVAPDAQIGDAFGRAVAISDRHVIVGAPREDCGWDENINEGSVYVYERIGTNSWDSGMKLTIAEGDVYDNFGFAVAISGDNAIIGALGDSGTENEIPRTGAVYLY